jgi:hypothetical protein
MSRVCPRPVGSQPLGLGRAARAVAPDCTATPMAAMDCAPRLKNWRREGWQSPEEQPQSDEEFVLDFDISLIRFFRVSRPRRRKRQIGYTAKPDERETSHDLSRHATVDN